MNLLQLKRFLLSVSAAFLAACGGGGSGSTGDAPAVSVSVYQPPVSAAATPQPATTGDLATDAISWANYRRAQLGLVPMARNALLDRAALSHANYIALNDSYALEGHDETPGKPGFTGVGPRSRIAATGYTTLGYDSPFTGENINVARLSLAAEQTDGLIDAPYHRRSQIGNFVDVGGGSSVLARSATLAEHYYVANFGSPATSWGPAAHQVSVMPSPGQQNAPTSWLALERPNPVPDLAGQYVGYPISLQSAFNASLVVSAFTLTDSRSAPLTGRLITTWTDDRTALRNQAFWIPLAPLAFDSSYTATATGTLNGSPMKLSWSFKTAAHVPLLATASAPALPTTAGSSVTVNWQGNARATLADAYSSYLYRAGTADPGGQFATLAVTGPTSATVTRNGTACDSAVYGLCRYVLLVRDGSGATNSLTLAVN